MTPTEKPTPTLDTAENRVQEPVQRTDELKPSGEPYFEPRNARTVFQFPSEQCYEDAAIGGAEVMVDVLRNVDSNGEPVHLVMVVERPMGMGQAKRWMFRDDRGVWFDLWTKKPCFAPEKPPTR